MARFEVYGQVGIYIKGFIEADSKEEAEARIQEKMSCVGFIAGDNLHSVSKDFQKVETVGWDMGLINVKGAK